MKGFHKKSIIWGSFVLCLFLSVCAVYVKAQPKQQEETVNAYTYLYTEPLQKGDSVEQTVWTSNDRLCTVEAAVSYEEGRTGQGTVLFEVLDQTQEVIVQQELELWACPNEGFLKITLPKKAEIGEAFTIRISNTSSDDTTFSVLYTKSPYRLSENLEAYAYNGVRQEGQLINRCIYSAGYELYPAVTWVIWIMLAWVIFAGMIQKREDHF